MLTMPSEKHFIKGNLPNLIIIGAPKCGTTSLYYYLGLHPQIYMSREKELNFFIEEANWKRGVHWYKSNFTGKEKIHGEASPNYTNYPFFSSVPLRMHSIVPKAKLIYIVRDPIERIISHYVHRYAEKKEHRTIEDALSNFENNPYIHCSMYYMQLEQYLRIFSKPNILILTTEDLHINRRKTLQEIFDFLNIDRSFFSYKFLFTWHKSKYKRQETRSWSNFKKNYLMRYIQMFPFELQGVLKKLPYLLFSREIKRPKLSEGLRHELIKFLKTDINYLRKHTGHDFKDWCL